MAKLLFADHNTGHVKHVETKEDAETLWPEPTQASYAWAGKTEDGKEASALLEGSLGTRYDRVDVMAEVPGFVKTIVANAAGTKPYIYQYHPTMTLELKVGEETKKEEGKAFIEATFVS